MAKVFKRRTRGGKLSAYWWASWTDHEGKPRTRSTGTANEVAAKAIASDWETDDALCRHGQKEHIDRRSIEQLLKEYKGKLKSGDTSDEYVEDTLRMIRAICSAKGFRAPADIRIEGVEQFAAGLQEKGRSARTRQKWLKAIGGFTKWLYEMGKLPKNPLARLRKPSPHKDRRHVRRMLLPDEWSRLAAATAAGPDRRGMSGADRLLLYRVAIETGLRANELRSLTRASVVFDATRPYVRAEAGSTKNRKIAKLYIRAGLAADLRSHVATKTPPTPLFALPDKWRMADLLRADLAAARKTWLDEARRDPEELVHRQQSDFLATENHVGQTLDFHSLRHTCGARGWC